jgi:transposase
MAKRYRPVDRDQPFLFPPGMRDWLPPGHPAWLVITVVEDHLDTSAFHALRRTGRAGTAGYDPDMLVTVLVWAYAHQVTSSRRVQTQATQPYRGIDCTERANMRQSPWPAASRPGLDGR